MQDGWTPLLHSVKLNALDSMDLLLRRGADPNVRNYVRTCMLVSAMGRRTVSPGWMVNM
jgi:ankyrin repeat protein